MLRSKIETSRSSLLRKYRYTVPAATPAAVEGAPAESPVPSIPPSPAPSVAPPPRTVQAAPQPVASLAGLRILIEEDDEAIRRPMARFLTWRGAEVLETGDGEQALARLDQWPADVILADLRMPRMDGIELYRKLEHARPDLAARMMFLSGDVFRLADSANIPVAPERVLVNLLPGLVAGVDLRRHGNRFKSGAGRFPPWARPNCRCAFVP